MAPTKMAGQVKTVDVARGLFVVRYVSADEAVEPPIVTFATDQSYEDSIEFFLHPDADRPVLWQPGSSLVMRTTRSVKVQVEVTPRREGGSIAANVRVERLTQGEPVSELQNRDTVDFTGLRLMGHVAGIGDVFVNLNEWIAGPSAPSRIEGIGIQWPNKLPQFDLRYSVRLGQTQAAPSQMMDVGSFAGTRGRAMPLTGVIFELSGAASADYQVRAEATFLGCPAMRVIGKRVVLSGPSGREPLVGLRINLERAAGEDVNKAPVVESSQPAPESRRSDRAPATSKPASRVRVFRSRSKDDQSAG